MKINYNPDTSLSFYRTNKITNDIIEDNIKLLSVISSLWADKIYDVIVEQNIEGLAFNIENIQKRAKEMFNKTINNFPESYERFLCTTLVYDNNAYKYFDVEGGGDYAYVDCTELIKAEKENDGTIYIYDNYVRIDETAFPQSVTCYASSDATIKLKEEHPYSADIEKSIDVLPIYKHTFKQRGDGTYYWVSSELTKKNELSIIQ